MSQLEKLITCRDEDLQDELDYIDNACNGIALCNSIIQRMKQFDDTDDRNRDSIVGYLLQKLCDLNGISNMNLYSSALENLKNTRKEQENDKYS